MNKQTIPRDRGDDEDEDDYDDNDDNNKTTSQVNNCWLFVIFK